MHTDPRLPFCERLVLDAARRLMMARDWSVGGVKVRPDASLRVGHCTALRRAVDGRLIGYHVSVLIDPKLGVP